MNTNYQNDNVLSRSESESRVWLNLLNNIGTQRPVDVPAPTAPPVEKVLDYLLSLCPAPRRRPPILRGGGSPAAAPMPPRKGRKTSRRSKLDNRGDLPKSRTEATHYPSYEEREEEENALAIAIEERKDAARSAREADIARYPQEHKATITKFYNAVASSAADLDHARRDREGKALLREAPNADIRYEVLTGLQKAIDNGVLSYNKTRSLSGCLRNPISKASDENGRTDSISIHAYPTMTADGLKYMHAILGIQHCSSPLRCPVCSAKLSYVRRADVSKAIEKMVNEENCTTYFLTLTAPHAENTDIVEFVRNFRSAKNDFGKSNEWKIFAQAVGYEAQIVASELTVDAPWSTYKTGPHFHGHSALFIRSFLDDECLAIARHALSSAWTKACERNGLIPLEKKSAHREHGLHLEAAQSTEKTLEYLLKEVSFEISPPPLNKSGRREGDRLSQWQLMRLATSTHPDLLPQLDEVLLALSGVRALFWSKGLKKKCGIEPVKKLSNQLDSIEISPSSSQDIEASETRALAAENAENQEIMKGEEGVKIIEISYYDWIYVCRYGAQRLLLKSLDILSDGILLDEEAANEILHKICNGINPLTGEVLRPIKSDLYTYKEYHSAMSTPPLAVAA